MNFISVTFDMEAKATLHFVPESGCYLVNQNDLLGKIYIYVAFNLNLKFNFDGTLVYKNGSSQKFKAIYDNVTNRLIFDVQGVCMSII